MQRSHQSSASFNGGSVDRHRNEASPSSTLCQVPISHHGLVDNTWSQWMRECGIPRCLRHQVIQHRGHQWLVPTTSSMTAFRMLFLIHQRLTFIMLRIAFHALHQHVSILSRIASRLRHHCIIREYDIWLLLYVPELWGSSVKQSFMFPQRHRNW